MVLDRCNTNATLQDDEGITDTYCVSPSDVLAVLVDSLQYSTLANRSLVLVYNRNEITHATAP